MVFCWKLNPNNFCIVLSWPLSYLFTILSWLPLWFPSVCWLCVYHWRLHFSQVLMSFIGHLVITCLNILVSLCSCQCILCISASLSEISAQCIQTELKSSVSKKLQAEGRMVWRCPWKCSQAQGELSWAQLANPLRCSTNLCELLAKIEFCSESRRCLEFYMIRWKITSFLSLRDCWGPGLPVSKQMANVIHMGIKLLHASR